MSEVQSSQIDCDCHHCGVSFKRWPCDLKKVKRAFCSHACSDAFNKTPWDIRFWRHVEKTEGCWLWTASVDTKGYGQMVGEKGRKLRAHRVSWRIHKGPVPKGKLVCHSCDVRRCVNPDHLFVGTHADNSADMVGKGRGSRGEKRPLAKLTAEQIPLIRQMRNNGITLRAIGERFGVSEATIHRAATGACWGHVS